MKRGRTALAVLVVASAAAGLAGCASGAVEAAPAPAASVPAVPTVPVGGDSPSARFGADASGGSATSARPVRVRIPEIAVDAGVVELGTGAGGELVPPAGPHDTGWYGGSAVPGEIGPAVLAGHVDSADGPAVFYRLGELRAGATVHVARSDGRTARYTVVRTERHAQARFPTAAVYGATPERALRLITCGGPYDPAGVGYRDNVVVFAVAASPR